VVRCSDDPYPCNRVIHRERGVSLIVLWRGMPWTRSPACWPRDRSTTSAWSAITHVGLPSVGCSAW